MIGSSEEISNQASEGTYSMPEMYKDFKLI